MCSVFLYILCIFQILLFSNMLDLRNVTIYICCKRSMYLLILLQHYYVTCKLFLCIVPMQTEILTLQWDELFCLLSVKWFTHLFNHCFTDVSMFALILSLGLYDVAPALEIH